MRQQLQDFSRKAGLVTGAGSGIGRATAIALAERGAKVLVCDIDQHGASRTVEQIRAFGGIAEAVCGDVADRQYAARIANDVIARFGSLDFAHNNAGIETSLALTADTDPDDFARAIAINLSGVWLCMRAQLQKMVGAGKGSIVNTSSVAGLTGVPGASSYCAAKHAVIGITKTAAAEYAAAGIRVNAICPGLTRSGMTERLFQKNPGLEQAMLPPMKRMGEPAEIADAVAFLLSDAAAYLTGQAVTVDGGATAS
jgi:NAD(P)-dependent dehydrogenase (short-subunit alcohol dehydrogenase family)